MKRVGFLVCYVYLFHHTGIFLFSMKASDRSLEIGGQFRRSIAKNEKWRAKLPGKIKVFRRLCDGRTQGFQVRFDFPFQHSVDGGILTRFEDRVKSECKFLLSFFCKFLLSFFFVLIIARKRRPPAMRKGVAYLLLGWGEIT